MSDADVISIHGDYRLVKATKGSLVLEKSTDKKIEIKPANKDQWDLEELKRIKGKEFHQVKKISKGTLELNLHSGHRL